MHVAQRLQDLPDNLSRVLVDDALLGWKPHEKENMERVQAWQLTLAQRIGLVFYPPALLGGAHFQGLTQISS